LQHVIEIVGPENGSERVSSLSVLLLPQGPLFITDAYINVEPSAEQIVNTTLAAARRVRDFGIKPKVALLSHSNFGSSRARSAIKMREATRLLHELHPELELEGEMHADAALNEMLRHDLNRDNKLAGQANLLVMPTLDAANIAVELIRSIHDVLMIGPILSGTAKPAHIVTPATTAKGLFNISAIAVADVWRHANVQRRRVDR
jgi:malate dehydrogenase (oxaloacetate-decarboxylating)(NADP+)